MSRYYRGTGPVSPAIQAEVAYREMRRSLIEYAAVEAEFLAKPNMTSIEETLLVGRRSRWAERVRVFAAVYHVERDLDDRLMGKHPSYHAED